MINLLSRQFLRTSLANGRQGLTKRPSNGLQFRRNVADEPFGPEPPLSAPERVFVGLLTVGFMSYLALFHYITPRNRLPEDYDPSKPADYYIERNKKLYG
ncbi:hypothetical protein HDE_04906 [Halotydeus destructor]|nr:hypothetical protein HDE_04906 [Halotydeus destructor]